MRVIALIPARFDSTRLPGKLMHFLGDKTIIAHTYLNAVHTELFDEVAVVSDSDVIEDEITSYGGAVYRSTQSYESGTDRIAEFAKNYNASDIIINLQGDEPFLNQDQIKSLINLMKVNSNAQVATLKHRIYDINTVKDPNCVKVVTNNYGKALLFTRSPIPYHRNMKVFCEYYRHIGIYAFRQEALKLFATLPVGLLERIEQQEALRFLENGVEVYVVDTEGFNLGIDTIEDIERAKEYLKNLH